MVMSGGLMEGASNDWLNLSMVDGYGLRLLPRQAIFAFFLLMMAFDALCFAAFGRRLNCAHFAAIHDGAARLSACCLLLLHHIIFGNHWRRPGQILGLLWSSRWVFPLSARSVMTPAHPSALDDRYGSGAHRTADFRSYCGSLATTVRSFS